MRAFGRWVPALMCLRVRILYIRASTRNNDGCFRYQALCFEKDLPQKRLSSCKARPVGSHISKERTFASYVVDSHSDLQDLSDLGD